MSTAEARRALAQNNQLLRDNNISLKQKKDQIADHLSALLRRRQQMQALKKSLAADLEHANERSKALRNKRSAYIDILTEDVRVAEAELINQSCHYRKLEAEYEICLKDYDNVLKLLKDEIEACRILQAEISNQKENNENMKAIIFDYERLKRVLKEQRNYFKELSCSEEKSHQQRVGQLQKILNKLTNEQSQSEDKLKICRIRKGLNNIHMLFKRKKKNYAEFLRNQLTTQRKIGLGTQILQNCLVLGSLKHRLTTRKLFYKWHHNVYPKQSLRRLVEDTVTINLQSFQKLRVLNKMVQITYDKNLAVFHLYQKAKYVGLLVNKAARKDLHYGFTLWRSTYHKKTELLTGLSSIVNTIPQRLVQISFNKWKKRARFESRLVLADKLLNEYLNTKQISRIFRKWRLQVPKDELSKIEHFIFRLTMQTKISRRINYEKRKSKILTSLGFKLTKIKLRNYFTKYWTNVKDQIIQTEKIKLQTCRNSLFQAKATQKKSYADAEIKQTRASIKVFRVFMMNSKLKPVLKKWQNVILYLRKRSQLIRSLCLKKVYKTKILTMNEFRKCVQYYEKKQMHQVLTDLNNKMQTINEKSNHFRERLKKCIEDLGVLASKKISALYNQTEKRLQRVYFDTHARNQTIKLYKSYILHRFMSVLNISGSRTGFNEVSIYFKQKKKQIVYEGMLKKFEELKIKRIEEKVFYVMKGKTTMSKKSFKLMGHSENIIMFHRMAVAFVALEKKNVAEKIKGIQKKIAGSDAILKTKQDNIVNLEDQKKKLEDSLRKIFTKFINFEEININLKEKQNIDKLNKRYFTFYRQKVQQKIYAERVLLNFAEFIGQKNRMIFWKGANAIKYENIIIIVKDQLAKVNKKKKAFQDKQDKSIGDIEKRLQQSEAIHSQKLGVYTYYLKKFESILSYYERRHFRMDKIRYLKSIFNEWKKQYKGAKGLALGVNRVLQRNLVYLGYQEIAKKVKKMEAHEKSQIICFEILERRVKNCGKDCLLLWRCNIRKIKAQKLEDEALTMIRAREQMTCECKEQVRLVADENLRMKRKKLLTTCFMAFKTQITEKIYEQRYKIQPFKLKSNQRLLWTTLKGLKWLMFYKRTKRSYLKFKKEKSDFELKRDVFVSLKIYRQEHYTLVSKTNGIYTNMKQQLLRFALDKVLNFGAHERDKLNYERKKALRHLVMNKVTKSHMIKRKLMAKWRAWLIPKSHYLPNILKTLEICALRRYFSNIKEHAYWNPVYITKAADTITSEGYAQINSVTNNLVKEGFDPEEIKEYLSSNNDKDCTSIKSIVNKMKVWGGRQDIVRGWNSWKQYVRLKGKIRKSLSKVIKIAEGIGRFWNRWRSKDPHFNSILEKQSRSNMLNRYKDLGRLLKQYKRDVKQSTIYCEELREVNDQYAEKNDEGMRIALSALSNNLKKGLKQGLQIWRTRLRQQRKQMLNQRYDQLSQGISLLVDQRNKLKFRLIGIRQQNKHMKQKCNLGKQCGQILEKLFKQRDSLSIDLADKEHNMKLLLEDNLRLKQKIRAAKQNAEKLINKVQNYETNN